MLEIAARLARIQRLVEAADAALPMEFDSLTVRLRALLREQQELLAKALAEVRRDPFNPGGYRPLISAIYRVDAASQSAIREWVRLSIWAHGSPSADRTRVAGIFQRMFEELAGLVPTLTDIYGPSEVRYIAPSDYLVQGGVFRDVGE